MRQKLKMFYISDTEFRLMILRKKKKDEKNNIFNEDNMIQKK